MPSYLDFEAPVAELEGKIAELRALAAGDTTVSIGEEVKDNVVELAVYFYPKGFVPKHRTVLRMFDVSRGSELDIPPNSKTITPSSARIS